jgi:transmembrane sensor
MAENDSNIDDIIISFLKDKISLQEKKILEEWLASDASNNAYFKQVYKIWNTADLLKNDDSEVDKMFQKVKYQMHNPGNIITQSQSKSRNIVFSLGKWAAVILISLGAGAYLYSLKEKETILFKQKDPYNEISVPMGSKSKIRLPDGTEVTLNAGSKLTYRMDYGKTLREVDLSGEGYFKVAKLKEKPFIVHTSKANIKALGTEFNVKAYSDENIVETILVEGSVAINEVNGPKNAKGVKSNESIILKPGQKLQILKNTVTDQQSISSNSGNNTQNSTTQFIENHPEISIKNSNPQVETSWKDKRWIIQGANMENLAVLLSRKFDINIHIKDSELKNYKFSGIIENETIEQIFSIMKFTIPISYTIVKGEVTWSVDRNRENYYKEAY